MLLIARQKSPFVCSVSSFSAWSHFASKGHSLHSFSLHTPRSLLVQSKKPCSHTQSCAKIAPAVTVREFARHLRHTVDSPSSW